MILISRPGFKAGGEDIRAAIASGSNEFDEVENGNMSIAMHMVSPPDI